MRTQAKTSSGRSERGFLQVQVVIWGMGALALGFLVTAGLKAMLWSNGGTAASVAMFAGVVVIFGVGLYVGFRPGGSGKHQLRKVEAIATWNETLRDHTDEEKP